MKDSIHAALSVHWMFVAAVSRTSSCTGLERATEMRERRMAWKTVLENMVAGDGVEIVTGCGK